MPTLPAADRPIERLALEAEALRAEQADIWGRPVRGLPRGLDLLQAMRVTRGLDDLVDQPKQIDTYHGLCASLHRSFDRTADVRISPDAITGQLPQHQLVWELRLLSRLPRLHETAPAPDGIVYFPTPLDLPNHHPIHALTWHTGPLGDATTLYAQTITATGLLTTDLPPRLAASVRLPATHYSPNSLTAVLHGIPTQYGDPFMWGAPTAVTTLALLAAVWDLWKQHRHAPEQVLTVPEQGTLPARKGKNGKKRAPRRRLRNIRILVESTPTPPATTDTDTSRHAPAPDPADAEVDGDPAARWRDDTQRWRVPEQHQKRCPNPRRHREIIESGGECKAILVPVREHHNGPVGRPVDPRHTVRVLPNRTPDTTTGADTTTAEAEAERPATPDASTH
ncbi:hypothetical protein [Streptomyces sp. NBC_00470]|uniref:hypothetical protein n=1 Tax=Streptomyces sp. NBC_00470 TaxID=2975753 RepID=UPI002F90FAA2